MQNCTLIQPHMDYCSLVWKHLSVEKMVEAIHNAGMRIILGASRTVTGTEMRQKLDWTTLAQRRKLHTLKAVHGCIYRAGPTYLHHKFRVVSGLGDRQTRANFTWKGQERSTTSNLLNIQLQNYGTPSPPSSRMLQGTLTFIKACKTALNRRYSGLLFLCFVHLPLLLSFV